MAKQEKGAVARKGSTLAPKGGGGGAWRSLKGAALAQWLHEHPTVADTAWAGTAKRRSGETRADFVDRVLGTKTGGGGGMKKAPAKSTPKKSTPKKSTGGGKSNGGTTKMVTTVIGSDGSPDIVTETEMHGEPSGEIQEAS